MAAWRTHSISASVVGVGGEAVDGDDDVDAEADGVGDVLGEVAAAGLQQRDVLFGVGGVEGLAGDDSGASAVHLECADGGDDDDAVGSEAGDAALERCGT